MRWPNVRLLLKSKSTPLSRGFNDLPVELQIQIFQYAANAWIHQYVEYMWYWKAPNGARIFLCFLDVDRQRNAIERAQPQFIMQIPPLKSVSTASPNTMYYALLNYGFKERVPVGEDIHLFFEKMFEDSAYQGLQERVRAEEERLREMKEEMAQIWEIVEREMKLYNEVRARNLSRPSITREELQASVAMEMKPRSKGYIRLPLYNCEFAEPPRNKAPGVVDEYDFYPSMPQMEYWEVRTGGWKPLPGYYEYPAPVVPVSSHNGDNVCSCVLCEESHEKEKPFCGFEQVQYLRPAL